MFSFIIPNAFLAKQEQLRQQAFEAACWFFYPCCIVRLQGLSIGERDALCAVGQLNIGQAPRYIGVQVSRVGGTIPLERGVGSRKGIDHALLVGDGERSYLVIVLRMADLHITTVGNDILYRAGIVDNVEIEGRAIG